MSIVSFVSDACRVPLERRADGLRAWRACATAMRRLLRSCLVGVMAASAPFAEAQEFSDMFVFGGSYSDAGTYLVEEMSRRWTINPYWVWNQHLGDAYGIAVTPNVSVETELPTTQTFLGGDNYAQGGARVFAMPGEAPFNTRTVADQVAAYLVSTGGVADPDALYSLEGGGNDIFYWNTLVAEAADSDPVMVPQIIAEARVAIQEAAGVFVDLADGLVEAGAERVLVINIHDIGVTPVANAEPPVLQAEILSEVSAFNDIIETGLAALERDNFILVDLYTYIHELVDGGTAYGFANVSDAACTPPSAYAIYCEARDLTPIDKASTYLFSDWVHPSGPGHIALFQYIQSLIEALYLVGLAAEAPIADGRAIFHALDQRLWWEDNGAPGWRTFASGEESGLWADAQGSTAAFAAATGSLSAGVEYRGASDVDFGAMFSASYGNADFSGGRGGFDSNMYAGTAYAALRHGNAFAQISGSAGFIDFPSIERHFDIYLGDRTNSGSTEGSYLAGRLVAGADFAFNGGGRLTPFAALSYQQVRIDGYAEDQNNASTMVFGDQRREALFATVGARLACEIVLGETTVRPSLNVGFSHELLDQSRELLAGIADPGDVLFATPLTEPGRNWWDVDAGAAFELRPGIAVSIGAGARFGDGLGQLWARTAIDFAL